MRQLRAALPPALELQELAQCCSQSKISPWSNVGNRAGDMIDILTVAQRGAKQSNPYNAGEREHSNQQRHAKDSQEAWN